MNVLDRMIGWFNPQAAVRRQAARSVLAIYEAGEPSRLRKFHRERGSQNEIVQRGARAVRAQARHLARNHDISRGMLRTMVNNIVGPNGIGIEPQPLRLDGTIHTEYAAALRQAYIKWCRYPEVTHRLPWSRLQRSLARAWLRDGEAFAQLLIGPVPGLQHGSAVPLSIEAFEADYVPFDLNDINKGIVQGFELNQWGRPRALHVLKNDPTQLSGAYAIPNTDTKRVPWERVLHIATLDHIGQVRGVSEFASIITRLEDIKDYEESERIAAKIAARLTAYIRKGTPDLYNAEAPAQNRHIAFEAGTIIDDLLPGEEVGMIDSKRPNPNVVLFRQGQLRAAAAGFGISYSSASRDYNGTYSAQRQELVEQWVNYAVLCDEFTGEIVQPTWEAFVQAAHLSGAVPMPADLQPGTAAEALFIAQSMPWIDPLKEANGFAKLLEIDAISETEVIRKRGASPTDVLQQTAEFRRLAEQQGVQLGARRASRTTGQGATVADDDREPPPPTDPGSLQD